MPQIGAAPIPLKGPEGFRGLTTLSKSAPFQFLEIDGGYVSSDASEIRMMPGYVCVVDPASPVRDWSTNQPFGFIANHFMARRGGIASASGYKFEGSPTEQQYVWTRPTQLHCVENVNGRWIFVGSSDYIREPIFNAGSTGFVKVISYDDVGGTQVALTLDAAPLTTANFFNALAAGGGDRVSLDGLTGAGATGLNGKGHNIVSIAGAVVTINTNIGVIANQTGQSGYIDRVNNNGQGSGGSTAVSDDVESLVIWTAMGSGSPAIGANQTMFPAHVFNRQRDFGDATLILKQGNRNAATVNGGRSRRRQKSLPYRLVPHIAGNRLILVAPGYGCVFQAPAVIPPNFDESSATFGVNSLCNDIYDQPRCLGVPKAVMWEDPDKTVAATAHIWTGAPASQSFGGSDASVSARAGTYKFKVAYRDEGTGEIGLCSEPITITTDAAFAAFEGIQLYVYFPGYLMHESGALNFNLYRTKLNGDTFFFDGTAIATGQLHSTGPGFPGETTKYGIIGEVATTEYFHHVVIRPNWRSDAGLEDALGVVPDVLEQMPMGCKAARTIRGFTLFGGALGDAGPRKELKKGTLTLHYDNNALPNNGIGRFTDRIISTFTNDFSAPMAASFEGVEEDFGCAARIIPPAYAGQTVVAKWFPFPRKQLQLNKLENTDMAYDGAFPNDFSGRIQDVRYSILDTPIRPETDLNTTATGAQSQLQVTHLRLPRAQTQISEPDNPGVTPATNTTVFASVRDDDIEAIGDAGGQAIVCTRAATYTIAFSQGPIGVPPDIASDGFGCIAPNSMVTFDGGCAWISERGPVAWSGGIQFIGESLEKHFSGETSRYLKDSTGMMRHSWACHDPERKLIYFGVFANRAVAAGGTPLTVNFRGATYNWTQAASVFESGLPVGDKVRSLFPCDEVLVYSYRTGAWSFWRPPLTMGILWMTRGVDSDGAYRVFFLGSDNRMYQFDDAYGQGDRESFKTTLLDTGTLSTLSGFTSSAMSRVGLTVAIYSEDATSGAAVLKALTTVTVDGGTSLTLAAPVAVVPGDIALVGARTMRIDTTFFNMKRTETTRAVKGGLRFQLWSRFGNGVGGSKQQAFVSASLKTEIQRDGIPTTTENSLTTLANAPTSYDWLGQDLPDAAVHEKGLKLGSGSGANHQLRLTFVGGAQVRLHDIYTEVQ